MQTRTALAHWINDRIFYGWVMLGMGFAGMFATGPGQSFNFSIFFNPLIEELGVSRTAISLAYAVGTGTAALGLSYVGRLVDRFGPRRMLCTLALLLGIFCMLFPLVSNMVLLYIAFTAVRFLGQGSMTLASTNLVSQWFSRRRGLALSITSLGFALGSAVYPPVVQLMIDTIGWRASWIWLGLVVWVLIIPAALALVINRPEDMALLPDGASASEVAGDVAARGEVAWADSWTQGEVLRSVTFWILGIALAIPSALITGMVIHQISYFERQGLSTQMAANIFTITAMAMVLSMLLFGYLLDRWQTRYVVSAGIVANAVAMWVMRIATDTPTAIVYGVVLGVASGAMMTNFVYIWPRYFGRKYLGGVQGVAYTIIIIGASVGPLPFAIAFDLLGGYHEVVLMLSVLPLVFGIAVAFVKPPTKRTAKDAPEPR